MYNRRLCLALLYVNVMFTQILIRSNLQCFYTYGKYKTPSAFQRGGGWGRMVEATGTRGEEPSFSPKNLKY